MEDISFGKRASDGFSPIIKNGIKTNHRIYLWDEDELNKLIELGKSIQNKNLKKSQKNEKAKI